MKRLIVVLAALGSAVRSSWVVRGGDVAQSFGYDLADDRRVFAKTHPNPPPGPITSSRANTPSKSPTPRRPSRRKAAT